MAAGDVDVYADRPSDVLQELSISMEGQGSENCLSVETFGGAKILGFNIQGGVETKILTSSILDLGDLSGIETIIEGLRQTASDKWGIVSINKGLNTIVFNITTNI